MSLLQVTDKTLECRFLQPLDRLIALGLKILFVTECILYIEQFFTRHLKVPPHGAADTRTDRFVRPMHS